MFFGTLTVLKSFLLCPNLLCFSEQGSFQLFEDKCEDHECVLIETYGTCLTAVKELEVGQFVNQYWHSNAQHQGCWIDKDSGTTGFNGHDDSEIDHPNKDSICYCPSKY